MRSIFFAIFLLGCGSKSSSESAGTDPLNPQVEEEDEDLGCAADSDCDDYEICDDTECILGDRSNGFTETEDITASTGDEDNTVSGYINIPGDKDYWRYVSIGSEFIRAAINDHEAVEEGEPTPDLFLTLYGPDGDVITSADDYANGGPIGGLDSVIYAYLERAGDYTLVVEDANPLLGGEAWGGPDYTYSMDIFERVGTNGSPSSLEDPMRFDYSGTGIQMTTTSWKSLGVLIDEPGQVDYVAVLFDNDNLDPGVDTDVEGNPYTWNDGIFVIDGVADLRGSDATPAVQILSPDDLVVSTGIDVGPVGPMAYPALSPGEWIVALSDADGGGGSNHWYFVLMNADNKGDNIPFEEEPNNNAATANPIDTTDTENGGGNPFSQGSVQGFVNGAGDNDWYTMSAPEAATGTDEEGEEAQWVVVCANSTLWGSSATPRLTLYGEDGAILAEAETSESATPNVRIENAQIMPGEQISIQVNPGVESEGAPDEWYRMKVFIASFEVLDYESGGYSCP